MLHHNLLVLLLYADIFAYDGIGTEPECQAYDEADADLSHNLILALQSLLFLAEYLDVVVEKA